MFTGTKSMYAPTQATGFKREQDIRAEYVEMQKRHDEIDRIEAARVAKLQAEAEAKARAEAKAATDAARAAEEERRRIAEEKAAARAAALAEKLRVERQLAAQLAAEAEAVEAARIKEAKAVGVVLKVSCDDVAACGLYRCNGIPPRGVHHAGFASHSPHA
jgi:dGTP triphosphohydrolase